MFKLRATSIGGVTGGSELESLKNWVGISDKGKMLVTHWRLLFRGNNEPHRLTAGSVPASYPVSVGQACPEQADVSHPPLNAAFVLELRQLRVPKD